MMLTQKYFSCKQDITRAGARIFQVLRTNVIATQENIMEKGREETQIVSLLVYVD